MEALYWNTALFILKLCFYIGFVMIAGHLFNGLKILKDIKVTSETIYHNYINRLCTVLIITALSQVMGFFVTVGAMVDDGIAGMLDIDMLEIVWGTSIGSLTLLRALGLILAFVFVIIFEYKKIKHTVFFHYTSFGICILFLLYSFTLTGHVSELSFIAQILLIIHVIIMAWWFGSLIPMRLACETYDYIKLYEIMLKFGKRASILVLTLLILGTILSVLLIGSIEMLLKSSYGQLLLIKIFIVTLILSLAVLHKYKFVPELQNNQGRQLLSQSINVETGLAILILSITVALTTFAGPSF